MENKDYNQNEEQKPQYEYFREQNDSKQDPNQGPNRKISKRLLGLIFLAAVVFAFFLGFMSSVITKVTFEPNNPIIDIPNNNNNNNQVETTAYTALYDFLEEHSFEGVDEERAFYYQLLSLVESLNDPYASISFSTVIIGPSGSTNDYDDEHFEGLGITFIYDEYVMKISDIMRGSPAEKAYIYPGDQIVGAVIDGRKIYFATTKMDQDEAIPYVRGVPGDTKTLIIKGLDESERIVTVTYQRFPRPTITSNYKDTTATYGYIKIHEFREKTSVVFGEHLRLIEPRLDDPNSVLIIDLRDNPGGLLTSVTGIIRQLLPSEDSRAVSVKAEKTGVQTYYGGGLKKRKPYTIKVLVNGKSASASEMLAAALHYTGGYEVYGQPTFGKNVYQNTKDRMLTKNLKASIKYTEGYWYYYDKSLGRMDKIDRETNPIPVNLIEPEGLTSLSIPYYTKDVAFDEVNEALASAQKFLNIYNPTNNLREDGYLDQKTKMALEAFQFDKGLNITGVYDLKTSQKMYNDFIEKKEDHTFDNQISDLIPWEYLKKKTHIF